MSPWLSAMSALERRLTIDKIELSHYRALSLVHEFEGVTDDALAMFISYNEDIHFGYTVIEHLMDREFFKRDEDTNNIILSEHAKMVLDEIYRLCHTRLTKPLFTPPER
ncbi:hypothetical protein MKR81_26845 (plasmid) [Vibrio campbellii]|uniref:hypothetical protein n=1 Tax=Vibrio campbellii TaxID=680 RepID=UPI001F081878|nr:hypothetical protein [Vibrio campbellii]UMM06882.1 hypothetical protein MKR81_26845 [Vibrio campbellii]